MNTTIISGNLTREPESRAVGDQSVINFSIANNDESKKQQDGSYVKIASFFDFEFWTKNPAHWLKQLVKGANVVVQGRLKQDRWEQDGTNRSRVKIIVDGYPIVVGGRQEEQHAPQTTQQPPAKKGNDFPGPEQFDDDIPF
jgi:single-strand DNA-binding protein